MTDCDCPKVNVTLHVSTLASALASLQACLKVANEVPDSDLPMRRADARRARRIMLQAIAELEFVKAQVSEADSSTEPERVPFRWTFDHG